MVAKGSDKKSDIEKLQSFFPQKSQPVECKNYGDFRKKMDYNDPNYAFYYKFIKRPIAYPLTWIACKSPIHPNLFSYSGYIFAFLSALFFSQGTHSFLILGIISFFLYELCDDFDGQSARFKGIKSRRGGWLDILAGTIGKAAIITGVSFGAFNNTKDPIYLKLGLIGLLGFMAYVNIDHVTKIRFSTVVQQKLKFDDVKPDIKTLAGKISVASELLLNTWAVFLIISAIVGSMTAFIYFNAIYYVIYPIALFFYINRKYREV